VEIVVHDVGQLASAEAALSGLSSGAATTDQDQRSVTVPVSGGTGTMLEALRSLDAAGIHLDDIALRRPTLDDVFLSLTGHVAETDSGQVSSPRSSRRKDKA
jgi:ABC-2 type transport system ATP-binding protein